MTRRHTMERLDLYERVAAAAPDLRGQLRELQRLGRLGPHSEVEVEEVRGRLFADHGGNEATR